MATHTGNQAALASKTDSHNYRRLAAAAAYLGTACLCVAILFPLYRLPKANLRIPFYGGSDAFFYSAVIKDLAEQGHYNTNALLGAPGHQELYDFPLTHAVHFGMIRILCLFSDNFALVENVYFLLGFPLISLAALFAFRSFKISFASAIPASILFAFLPYHWWRGEYHLFHASYYLLPLLVLTALWICCGEPLLQFQPGTNRLAARWLTSKGTFSLMICLLIASDTPYNAFFGAFFLLVAGLLAKFRYRRGGALFTTAVLVLVIFLGFILNLAPNLLYFYQHGRNSAAVVRSVGESQVYGLSIAQLVLPMTGHRLHAFRKLKEQFNQGSLPRLINENDTATLGIVATAGFFALLGCLLFGRTATESRAGLLDPLSRLNAAGVLLGTIGGFSVLFALIASPLLRAYNRISPFIAFFSLFTVCLLADGFWAGRSGKRVYLFSVVVVILGILDQTSKSVAPPYQQIQGEYLSDAVFVRQIEAAVPPGSMIFQLPYVPFPGHPPVQKMQDYDLMRGFLHSKQLRWSYGAMKGREDDQWQQVVAVQPVERMVNILASAGFKGIYLDRLGFADRAEKEETELTYLLHEQPLVSPDLSLSFFPLTGAKGDPEKIRLIRSY